MESNHKFVIKTKAMNNNDIYQQVKKKFQTLKKKLLLQPLTVLTSSFFIIFENSEYHNSEFYKSRNCATVNLGAEEKMVFRKLRNRVNMLFSKDSFSKFMVFFGYLMAIIYIALGGMLFIPHVYPGIPVNLKFAFSLFFIAYGLFRLVKMITKKSETND
jgi:hypothetical protein